MRRLGRLGRCSCAITAAAGELWSRIDHELVDRAPWVPLYNPRTVTALGNAWGNYKCHPFWNVLDQLCVR
jgi:hypothetical protein